MPKQDQSMQYRLALFAQAKELGINNLRPTMPNHKIEQLISQAKHDEEITALRKECKKQHIVFKDADSVVDLKKKLAKATSLEMKRQQSKQEEKAKKVLIGQGKEIGLKLSDSLTLKEMLFEIEVRSTFLKEQTVKQPLIDEAASLGIDLDVVLSVSEMKKTIKAKLKELKEVEMQKDKQVKAKEESLKKAKDEAARKNADAKAKRDAIAKAKKEAAQKIEDEKKAKLAAQKQTREKRKSLVAAMKQEGLTFSVAKLTNEQIEEKVNAAIEKRKSAEQKAAEKKAALENAKKEKEAKLAAQKEAERKAAQKAKEAELAEKAKQEAIAKKEAARLEKEKTKAKLAKEKQEAKAKQIAQAKKEKEAKEKEHAKKVAEKLKAKNDAAIAKAKAHEMAEKKEMQHEQEERKELITSIAKLEKEVAALLLLQAAEDKKEAARLEKEKLEAQKLKVQKQKAAEKKAALDKAKKEKQKAAAAKKEAARLAMKQESKYREEKHAQLVSLFSMRDLNEIAFNMHKDLVNVQEEMNELIEKVQSVMPNGQIYDFTLTPVTYDFYNDFAKEELLWVKEEKKIISSILVSKSKLGKTTNDEIDAIAKEIKKEITKLERKTKNTLYKKISGMNAYLAEAHEYVSYLSTVYRKDREKDKKVKEAAKEKEWYNSQFDKTIAKSVDPQFKVPARGIALDDLTALVWDSNSKYRSGIIAATPTRIQITTAKKLGITNLEGIKKDELAALITKAETEKAEQKEKARAEKAAQKAQEKLAKTSAKSGDANGAPVAKAETNVAKVDSKQETAIKVEKEVINKKSKDIVTETVFDLAKETEYAKLIGAAVKANMTEASIKAAIAKQEEKIKADLQRAIEEETAAQIALENELAKEKSIITEKQTTIAAIDLERAQAIEAATSKYSNIESSENNKLITLTKNEENKNMQLTNSIESAKGGIKKYPYVDLAVEQVVETTSIIEDTNIPAIVEIVKEQVIEKVEEVVAPVIKVVAEENKHLPKILTTEFNTKDSFKKTKLSNKWTPKK